VSTSLGGRSNNRALPTQYSSSTSGPRGSHATYAAPRGPSLATQLNDEERAGASSALYPNNRRSTASSRASTQHRDSVMSSYTSPSTLPAAQRSHAAKLHKRGGSGSSLPAPPSPMAHSQFTTPFATYEEPFPDAATTPPISSTPKLKPYIRKMSKQDDQGKLDLSKSVTENDRLAGLGIQDFGAKSASDVSFNHASRRGTHTRTTSVGSQVSNGSGSYRPTQPFVHPMRQTPRPYTPPTGSANASFINEDEASESDDLVEDDFRLGHGYRSKRSMSISSVPAIAPTPLSQSVTADDLGIVPKLTSTSQTNLSIRSGKSGKSSRSRHGRMRRETGPSFDLPTSPSSRTSFDKAFSFVSRKSDPEPQTRDERIRAARRKFEEKEANKDRRAEKEYMKRRQSEEAKKAKKDEAQSRKSEASARPKITKINRNETRASPKKQPIDEEQNEKIPSRSYEEYRPAHQMSLPRYGQEAGMSEKAPRAQERKPNAQTGWVRFSAWMQTRMLGCGGR
jgi:hypothetical protein